ncbi:hypothetical protein [Nonomuraea sp. NPDC050643]|uniref:hypothetical protein n=1 Tax=Nonomuraea sp. NPDC050643 TaxID=3155660 RepID=UPI0033D2382F
MTWYQEMVWWERYWDPQDREYPPMSEIWYLPQKPSIPEVRSAFAEVMARQEVLRTFLDQDELGIAFQGVRPLDAVTPPLRVMELSRLRADIDGALGTFRRPGPGSRGRLPWRAVLGVKDDRVLTVCLAADRGLMDGWSMVEFRRQLQASLLGRLGPRSIPLNPLERAAHERSRDGRGKADAALSRLARVFASAPESLVPGSARDPAPPPYKIAVMRSTELLADTDLVCHRLRLTRPTVVLGVLVAVLALRTGQWSCPIRSLVANRDSNRERETIQGLYQRAYLNIDLSGDPSMPEVLRRTWQESVSAYQYTRYPEDEVRELRVHAARARGFVPKFEFIFDFMVSGLPSRPVRADSRRARQGALPPVEHQWRTAGAPEDIFIAQVAGEEMTWSLRSDSAPLTPEEVDQVLRWTARGLRLLTEEHNGLRLSEFGRRLGIEPRASEPPSERCSDGGGGPSCLAEAALAAALLATHPLEEVDLTQDYVGAGGRLHLVSRFAAELSRRGYHGLRAEHVESPMSLRAVAAEMSCEEEQI